MARRVVLYELNEVPWYVVDHYATRRPQSLLARLIRNSSCYTTICDDPEPLQPWRTWPTFHNSLYTSDHGSYDLGQDPSTFRGTPLWDAADAHGRRVGLFGPLQSWPAKPFRSGGFHVPDTFARTAETVPSSLSTFQDFNLRMTRDNTFNAESPLNVKELISAGVDLVKRGLRPSTALKIASHLALEVDDARHKASRPTVQALPSFDLYWRLHQQYSPELSIFFTNHVASMMHRYWGDGIPGYTSTSGYQPDDVYARFVVKAMDLADQQLARIKSWMRHRPDVVLVVASSMGQFAIDKEDVDEPFVLEDAQQFAAALGLAAETGMAMYPRTSLLMRSEEAARAAVPVIESIHSDNGAMFGELRVVGRSISFAIDQSAWGRPRTQSVKFKVNGNVEGQNGQVGDLGVAIRRRMGGGNTAYHVPEGVLIAHGLGLPIVTERPEVSVLDAAPSLLRALSVPSPATYKGEASMDFVGESVLSTSVDRK